MTIPTPTTAFDEIIDFLASVPSADEIIAYVPPIHIQDRMHELMQKNRTNSLSSEENTELDEFLRMNRFMSRLKAKVKASNE